MRLEKYLIFSALVTEQHAGFIHRCRGVHLWIPFLDTMEILLSDACSVAHIVHWWDLFQSPITILRSCHTFPILNKYLEVMPCCMPPTIVDILTIFFWFFFSIFVSCGKVRLLANVSEIYMILFACSILVQQKNIMTCLFYLGYPTNQPSSFNCFIPAK